MLGAAVRICGLAGKQEEANGCEGVAESWCMLTQVFIVTLNDRRLKFSGWRKGEAKVHESNLEFVGEAKDVKATPKHSAAAASSAPKTKKPRAAAPDWRTPLFYWRGKVGNETSWSGTWVASADGLPCDADFAASTNTFELSCSEDIVEMSDGPTGTADAPAATFAGSFKLTTGNGLEDCSDIEHVICVQEGPAMGGPMGESEWVNVAGCGTNRFGKFLSLGKMVRDGGDDVLTLARRYIADEDPRCAMSVQDVLGRVSGEEEGPEMWACEEPWLALPWKVPKSWPAHRLPVPASMLDAAVDNDGP